MHHRRRILPSCLYSYRSGEEGTSTSTQMTLSLYIGQGIHLGLFKLSQAGSNDLTGSPVREYLQRPAALLRQSSIKSSQTTRRNSVFHDHKLTTRIQQISPDSSFSQSHPFLVEEDETGDYHDSRATTLVCNGRQACSCNRRVCERLCVLMCNVSSK